MGQSDSVGGGSVEPDSAFQERVGGGSVEPDSAFQEKVGFLP